MMMRVVCAATVAANINPEYNKTGMASHLKHPAQVALLAFVAALPAAAEIDTGRAARYLGEADALCRAENGRLWKLSLCGPMLFVDAGTRTVVANRPTPAAKFPADMTIANTATEWNGTRWTMVVWQTVPRSRTPAPG